MPGELAPAVAKELTKDEREKLVQNAFDLERRVKAAMKLTKAAWWSLAEAIWEFHELRGWSLLGYTTLAEFLAQPDLGMAESSYHECRHLWDDLHVTAQLPKAELEEVEHTKARQVLPAIKAGEVSPRDAMDDCKELGFRDVAEKYGLEARQRRSPDAQLDAAAEPERLPCPTCSTWVMADRLTKPVAAQVRKKMIDGTGREKHSARAE